MQYARVEAKWWVRAILFTAGLYGIIWGVISIIIPGYIFSANQIAEPNYQFIWQTVALMEIVFGLGYLMALKNPYKTWQPIFMGTLFKIFATLIYFSNTTIDSSLWSLSSFMLLDNLVWVPFFSLILFRVYLHSYAGDESLIEFFDEESYPLELFDASNGMDLMQISKQAPTMVVFLRHFGCTFCRESLTDIARLRTDIERQGTQVVLVHMLEDEDEAQAQISKYGLSDITTISDPEGILYKRFKLRKGTITQLFGLKVWFRGLLAGAINGHGLGAEMGDLWQMPGVFLLHNGKIKKSYIHNSAADRPSYLDLADCESCEG